MNDPIAAYHARVTKVLRAHKPPSFWRHGKTGEVYALVSIALDEAKLTCVAIYTLANPATAEDMIVWTRPLDEFLDGRFLFMPPNTPRAQEV